MNVHPPLPSIMVAPGIHWARLQPVRSRRNPIDASLSVYYFLFTTDVFSLFLEFTMASLTGRVPSLGPVASTSQPCVTDQVPARRGHCSVPRTCCRSNIRPLRCAAVRADAAVVLSPVAEEVAASAPATVANLGPGFDWLGCAVEVRVAASYNWMHACICL